MATEQGGLRGKQQCGVATAMDRGSSMEKRETFSGGEASKGEFLGNESLERRT